eukprot:scaffold13.g233.t1
MAIEPSMCAGLGVDWEFELSTEAAPLLRTHRAARRTASSAALPSLPAAPTRQRRRRQVPFASATMAARPQQQRRAVPAFTIASAAEAKPLVIEGVPQWRIAAGNLAAGATAGCAVEAVLYPIDTIKTRLQAMRSGGGFRALLQARMTLWQCRAPGARRALAGGGKALYAGVWGNLAGVAPASAIFMAVYEPVKKAIMDRVGEGQQFLGPLGGGAAAGLASSIVRVPTEVVKTRMQTGEFAHAWTAVRTILAREGRRGLFAGYSSFLLRDLPFDAIEFGSYEAFKRAYKTFALHDARDLNPAEHSVFGAVAGAFTGLVTTPLDGASGQYKGVLDCARQIVKQEGAGALFLGWQPRVMWIGIGGSVFFTVLEASKKLYAPRPPKQ